MSNGEGRANTHIYTSPFGAQNSDGVVVGVRKFAVYVGASPFFRSTQNTRSQMGEMLTLCLFSSCVLSCAYTETERASERDRVRERAKMNVFTFAKITLNMFSPLKFRNITKTKLDRYRHTLNDDNETVDLIVCIYSLKIFLVCSTYT